jgi:hypothetical protein
VACSDSNTTGTPSTVTCGFSPYTTTATDAILSSTIIYQGGSSVTAGAGFTLGPSSSTATIGQSEYWLGAPAGTTPVGFTGTQGRWVFVSVANKAAPVGGTSVQRHHGSVF